MFSGTELEAGQVSRLTFLVIDSGLDRGRMENAKIVGVKEDGGIGGLQGKTDGKQMIFVW